ncbi:flagellum-specific ATP synthase FliI, partial [Buchnera aphidicola (Hormaphis cornu)]
MSFIGLVLEVQGLELPIGALCIIESVSQDIKTKIEAEVVGFKDNKILMMLLRESKGIFPGLKVFSKVNSSGEYLENKFPIGSKLLGRVLDSQGNPLDGLETLQNVTYMSLAKTMINPLLREPINQVLDTG